MKTEDISNIGPHIIEFLKDADGENFSADQLGNKFKVGTPSVRQIMISMESEGLVRCVRGTRQPRWYVATDGQLELERRTNEPREVPAPLKIDPRKQELYAELQRARDAIPSLHVGRK